MAKTKLQQARIDKIAQNRAEPVNSKYFAKEYHPNMCDQLIEHMSTGKSFESFGGIVYCSMQTLYRWSEKYPEFGVAREVGKMAAMLYMETLAQKKASGENKDIDATMTIFLLKTRFWRVYGEKQRLEIEDVSSMTDAQLLEEAKELLEVYKGDESK